MAAAPIILVPGFWLGAWAWDEVAAKLLADGHEVRAITLPGQASKDEDRSAITFGDHVHAIVDAVEEFLTGVRPRPEPDRFLATVLFTDVVNGTARASDLGDRRWGELIEQHHATVRRELDRHRGVEVDTAGDGFFATFDAPGRAVRPISVHSAVSWASVIQSCASRST